VRAKKKKSEQTIKNGEAQKKEQGGDLTYGEKRGTPRNPAMGQQKGDLNDPRVGKKLTD